MTATYLTTETIDLPEGAVTRTWYRIDDEEYAVTSRGEVLDREGFAVLSGSEADLMVRHAVTEAWGEA